MPASLSWTSRPHRFPTTKRPNCSMSSATCGPAASASSTFRIDCAKSSNWPTASLSCATANAPASYRDDQNTRTNFIRLMIGRDVSRFYQRTPHAPGDEVLSVNNLRTTTFPRHPISFSLRAGEVVGLAGLVGAGRSELLATLFGVTPAVAGSMKCGPLRRPPRTCREAIAAGIMLAPEDRRHTGLILPMSVRANLSLASLRRDQFRWPLRGILNPTAENRVAAAMIELMRIKTASDRQLVRYLSGGNQQKVVLGKWLCLDPKLLLLDEPTRGIDVGAKEEIYKLIDQLARQGVAILFASSEMEEILGLADRALVMHDGRLAGQLSRAELTEEAVMRLATGDAQQAPERIGA